MVSGVGGLGGNGTILLAILIGSDENIFEFGPILKGYWYHAPSPLLTVLIEQTGGFDVVVESKPQRMSRLS